MNSFAGRVSYAPSRHWVVQISRGRLDSPEELLPGEDLTRTTASALYTTSKERGFLAAGLVWGRNDEEHHSEDGVGVEATWAYADKNELFGRFERVDRRGLIDLSDPDSGPQVQVSALSLGAGRDIATLGRMPLSLGGLFTVYDKDEILDPLYGENPVSFFAYLRLRPPRAHGGMHMPMAGHHEHGAAHP